MPSFIIMSSRVSTLPPPQRCLLLNALAAVVTGCHHLFGGQTLWEWNTHHVSRPPLRTPRPQVPSLFLLPRSLLMLPQSPECSLPSEPLSAQCVLPLGLPTPPTPDSTIPCCSWGDTTLIRVQWVMRGSGHAAGHSQGWESVCGCVGIRCWAEKYSWHHYVAW